MLNRYTGEDEYFTLDEFVINPGPEGLIAVWLTGIGRQVQVGQFYGEEVLDVDFALYNPDGNKDQDDYVRKAYNSTVPEEKQSEAFDVEKLACLGHEYKWKRQFLKGQR